jgi:hypothetical protein
MGNMVQVTDTTVNEQITIDVSVRCEGCDRTLRLIERLPGEALRTRNDTQRAVYWLDQMRASVLATAEKRTWDRTENGWRCAHCRAKELDKLAHANDPKERNDAGA